MNRLYKSLYFILIFLVTFQSEGLAISFNGYESIKSKDELYPLRAMHIVIKKLTPKAVKKIIDHASEAKFNTVILSLKNDVKFKTFPGYYDNCAWSVDQLKEVVQYIRKKDMRFVPEIKLLTHQNLLMYPMYEEYMYNKSTYNPLFEEVYVLLYRYIDEIIDALKPVCIHIGHDEVAGFSKYSQKKWMNKGEAMLPADLFLKDVISIYEYLSSKGIYVMMWGDMLISHDEFPVMNHKHLHGNILGYGKTLRDKIPKDIIICDWHYKDTQKEFPSTKKMISEGFDVIGTVWRKKDTINNFAIYSSASKANGMIVGLFYLPRWGEWQEAYDIIKYSGEIFDEYYPDKKNK